MNRVVAYLDLTLNISNATLRMFPRRRIVADQLRARKFGLHLWNDHRRPLVGVELRAQNISENMVAYIENFIAAKADRTLKFTNISVGISRAALKGLHVLFLDQIVVVQLQERLMSPEKRRLTRRRDKIGRASCT